MSIRRTFVRRRSGEEPVAPEAASEAPKAPVAAPVATRVRERTGLLADDLMALADMDPSEFAAALGQGGPLKPEVGDKVTGPITRIDRESVFVDIGAKAEAVLHPAELTGEGAGDKLTAFVVAIGDWGIQISRQLSGEAAAAFVEEAKDAGIPVQGQVTGRNKGGFVVQIGSVRAFCPARAMDRRLAPDPDVYLGQTYEFLITELSGSDVVVSRRELLDREAESVRETFWETAKIGDVHTGTVTSVQTFGAFVDLGGIDGLVHRTELSWSGQDPSALVNEGDILEVEINKLDSVGGKISLSPRSRPASPFDSVSVGSTHSGVVRRREDYGVFVELPVGLQGLLHVSTLSGGELPAIDEVIQVRVESVDRERQRVSLAPADHPGTEEANAKSGGNFGTLADLLGGWKSS